MAKTSTNWDSVETWERLVASIIATGVRIDLSSTATYYGTTYHTLENRLRRTKKIAKELQAAVDGNNGVDSVMSSPAAAKTPRKPKTPKKDALGAVSNGRVTKKTPTKTPTKKTTVVIKNEDSDDNMHAANGHASGQDSPTHIGEHEMFGEGTGMDEDEIENAFS